MTRKTKLEVVFLVALWIVGGLALEGLRNRLLVETWWWHLRHGVVVTVADYVMPAPMNWRVAGINGDRTMLMLMGRRNSKPMLTAVIGVSVRAQGLSQGASQGYSQGNSAENIDSWTSVQTAQLKQRGVDPGFQKLNFDGGTLSCVGGVQIRNGNGSEDKSGQSLWSCRSADGLELSISAGNSELPQVWEIVSHIHKKP